MSTPPHAILHNLLHPPSFPQVGILLPRHDVVKRLPHIIARFALLAVIGFVALMRQPR